MGQYLAIEEYVDGDMDYECRASNEGFSFLKGFNKTYIGRYEKRLCRLFVAMEDWST